MTANRAVDIQRIANSRDLAALGGSWNALAGGVPFRGYAWLESWWRSYGGPDKELFVLAARSPAGELVGLAPWYLQSQPSGQRVVRFLGSGEVCSDYLTILCRGGFEDTVTGALADWLTMDDAARHASDRRWDRLEMGGINQHDKVVAQLLERLAEHGKLVYRRGRASCWRVSLPRDWNAYLAMLSKSHRKQIRRLERNYFATGRARVRLVETKQQLATGLEALMRLHQRRRESLGDRGCFSSPRFAAFHAEIAPQLLAAGNLRLAWLELDGRTVAAEYQVTGGDVVYAYQSGIEPEALDHEPGRLITLAMLKSAIAEGRRALDFLRGDESYKAHWRAQPHSTQDVRVVANTPGARLRNNLWLAGGNVKSWLRRRWKRNQAFAD